MERIIGGRYRLQKKIVSGSPARGLPELWQGSDDGDVYFIRVWRQTKEASDAIQALWNREVRGLSRLQGYPGAAELFVRLHDLKSDADGFYAVLEADDRQPLNILLENRLHTVWLRNLGEFGRRRPLWDGLLRVAEALTILHNEGTLHRALDTAAIFADPGGQGQFRLSGFEWSLRVAAPEGEGGKIIPSKRLRAPELDRNTQEYSVATDWFDFGLVAAQLFGIDVKRARNRESIRQSVSNSNILRDSERTLLLQLLWEDSRERLSTGSSVTQQIREIVRELASVVTGVSRPLMLALRLGSNQEFTATIARAANGEAPSSDAVAQLRWVRSDLRGDVRVIARLRPYPHYVIRGEKLEYHIRPWTTDKIQTWDIGFCEKIEFSPRYSEGDTQYSLGSRRLEIDLYPNVRSAFNTFRDKGSPWNKTYPFGRVKQELEPHLKEVHDFFRVSQQLDTLLTAAQICPVEVLAVDKSLAETIIDLTPIEETERNDLAHHLGLDRPSVQLREWFKVGAEAVTLDDETDPDRDKYRLLESRTVDSDGSSATWRFRGAVPTRKGLIYRFSTDMSLSIREGQFYLARNHNGLMSQVRRRHRAIEDLRSYESLLRLIADPVGRGRDTGATLPPMSIPIELDGSKKRALGNLWSRQPAFLVQGPPGTGKTTLIKGFASTLFGSDRSAQILISAHSHHTVDDVRRKIAKMFDEVPLLQRPIILRLGANAPTEHDGDTLTSNFIASLSASPMALRASPAVRRKLALLADSTLGPEAEDEYRTLKILVQDSANVTLSTSNSGELAGLAIRGRRFDWSLVEEAGKAHGFDMAAALQVSHRLVLIGDHHQLPPYNANKFKDLIGNQVRLKEAFAVGAQFAPKLIDSSMLEDIDAETLDYRCQKWRKMVTFFGDLFERSVADPAGGAPLAATLTDQHRMHPDIAAIVGRAFYPAPDSPGGTLLESPQETHVNFQGPPPFQISADANLPPQRVIWCDVPWVQKKEFSEGEIDGLFASEAEARRVVDLLKALQPIDGENCEVQILSPYNDQLSCIRAAIEDARDQLDHVFKAPFFLGDEKRMGATVDEFQGSEADVVIVSLVRNNGLAPWRSLGFLKEQNRLNVLLSRARHKLFIVGSWNFFKTRVAEGTSETSEIYWWRHLMMVLEDAKKAGTLGYVEMSQ